MQGARFGLIKIRSCLGYINATAAILKVNGKGGQPVFVKLAGQDSGRCTPK